MEHIFAFQNHDLIKIILAQPLFFSSVLVFFCLGLLFFPFRKEASTDFMNPQFTDSLRGLAITAIIIGHFNYYVIQDHTLLFFGNLGSYGVPVFLLLSGYAMSESHKRYNLLAFFEKRFSRVYVPFVIANILFLLLDYVLLDKHHNNLLQSVIYFIGYKTQDRNYWFIHYIFFWYFLFFGAFSISSSKRTRVLLLFTGALFPFIFTSFGRIAQISSLCFPVGVFLSGNKEKINHYFSRYLRKPILNNLIIFILSLLVLDYFIGPSPPKENLFKQMSQCIHTVLITILLIVIAKFANLNRISLFFHFLGGISYELFLLHGGFMYSYDYILFKSPLYISFFIYLFLIILLSLILQRFSKIVSGLLHQKLKC